MGRGFCLFLVLFASVTLTRADEAEDRSAAYVKKIGGRIIRAEAKPGKPVIEVDLTYAKFTEAGLKELAGFAQLKKLYLFNTNVGDAGLQ
jgi:hypothetical protein